MWVLDMGGWRFFLGEDLDLGKRDVGKWMFFYRADGLEFAEEMCREAVESGVVEQAKRADVEGPDDHGVACFYLDAGDTEGHKRVLGFFLKHGLVRRTKSGRLHNISFKLDEQTRNGRYGKDFVPALRLSDFVDLDMGTFHA